jgi:DNA-binding response OmpR family regulator
VRAGLQPDADGPADSHNEHEPVDGPDARPTVLIVDDNAELRGFLRLRLGQAYRIVEASDGREGLEQARETLPDAIVTDGMMPEMDGLAMTAELKADPETDFIPVLMLTARGGPDAVVRGMQAGADDYLAKPFDSAELAARIAGLIASRRRLRERLAALPSAEPEPVEDPFLARARAVMLEQLAEPGFTIRDCAALLHMDRTTLFRKFKAAADRSPDEELREMRLQRAAELLRERAGNVAEVADAVGFASVSAFSRRFRERFSQSPAAYGRNGSPL